MLRVIRVFGHSQMVQLQCTRILRRLQTVFGSETHYIHTSITCDLGLWTPYKSCQVLMLYDDWCLLLVAGFNR